MGKGIAKFAGKFFLYYVVLILLLLFGFNKPFAGMFRSVGTTVFNTMWHNVDVHYKPSYSTLGINRLRDNDTQIQITNRNLRLPDGYPPMGSVGTNSRLQAYLPIAMMIALSLSLPLTLKRSIFVMVIGLALLSIWIVLLLGFVIVVYGELSGIGWYGFSEATKVTIQKLLEIILMNQIGLSYVVPFVLWGIVIIVTGDYRQIITLFTEKEKTV